MSAFATKYSYYLRSIFKLLTGVREWPLMLRVYLGQAGAGPHCVHLRRNGPSFWIRGAMDMWSVKETFLDRMYERYGTRIEDGWTIVDIGAGIGDFTIFAALDYPRNRVFGFEPCEESFALLERNIAANGITGIQGIRAAVSGTSGRVILDDSAGEPLQFRSRVVPDRNAERLDAPSFSLEDALNFCHIENCDLLKLDCEGAEYEIIMAAQPSVLARIRRIVLEYHNGVTPHSHTDLAAFLEQQGYAVRTQRNAVHSHLGYLYCYRR
jgi:FkbM family methyltransferase